MKCNNCGYEEDGTFRFCPACGKDTAADQMFTPPTPTVRDKALAMLKDDVFLVLCILETIAVGTGLFSGNLNLLGILFTIFLWMVWAKGRKDQIDIDSMRRISGTIWASYIIDWVLFGLMTFSGILVTALSGVIAASMGEIKDLLRELNIIYEFDEFEYAFNSFLNTIDFGSEMLAIVIVAIGIVLILAAIVVALVNVLGIGKMHKFAKSLYISAGNNDNSLVSVKGAKVWMLICGICSALTTIDALMNITTFPLAFISNACTAAVYIIAFILVNKHFDK